MADKQKIIGVLERVGIANLFGLVLLLTFISSVLMLFLANINVFNINIENKKDWFDLLKSALVLLGTSLTTIIGYYFGHRDTEQARNEADKAKKKVRTAEEIMDQLRSGEITLDTGAEAINLSAIDNDDPADFDKAKEVLRRKV